MLLQLPKVVEKVSKKLQSDFPSEVSDPISQACLKSKERFSVHTEGGIGVAS